MKTIAGLVLARATSVSWSAEPIARQIKVKGEGSNRVAPDFVAIAISIGAEGRNYESDPNDNEIFKEYAVGRTLEIRLRQIENYEALAQELVAAARSS